MPILSSYGSLKPLSNQQAQPYFATFLNSEYCIFNTTDLSPGANDYSVEFFLNQSVSPPSASQDCIFDAGYLASSAGLQIAINNTRNIIARFGNASGIVTLTSSSTVNTGTWYYIALSRVSGTTRMFINSTQVASDATVTWSLSFPNNKFGAGINSLTTNYLFGNLASFRLNVGSGFTSATVPTGLLPITAETKLLTFQKSTVVNEVNNTTATTNTGVYMTPGGPF